MNNYLNLIERKKNLFFNDIQDYSYELNCHVSKSSFLVIGGAGSIGQSVCKEIFKRSPLKLHVVDISENNLVELVRDLRSTFGYISGEFKTFVLDVDSFEYDAFIESDGNYDYVLNLSALKHVRSERDPFTLMRMINVNILNTKKTLIQAIEKKSKKYFCVSTDKASNPVNMMGASKKIMEMFLLSQSSFIDVSTARFANVAFSDGSLLKSIHYRLEKRQPIVAPSDIKRYFLTHEESGQLCLLSCIFGENKNIFFPKLTENFNLINLTDIAMQLIESRGYEPHICVSEEEARTDFKRLFSKNKWPCFFSSSDTTGEKKYEEFYSETEDVIFNRFNNIGVIKNQLNFNADKLVDFQDQINLLKRKKYWTKEILVKLFFEILPNFDYIDLNKSLDDKM